MILKLNFKESQEQHKKNEISIMTHYQRTDYLDDIVLNLVDKLEFFLLKSNLIAMNCDFYILETCF